MTYSAKEIFKTLQGEGAHAGRAAVFCRFAGCNLWTGRESDRASAACTFCDTDFIGTDGEGGGKFTTAQALADAIAAAWGPGAERRYVVFTGGEPLLQLDEALLAEVHARGFTVAIETNGTMPAPAGIGGSASAPRARRLWCWNAATNSSWSIRKPMRCPNASRTWISSISSCNPWTVPPRGEYRTGRPVLYAASAMAAQPANA